MRRLLVTLIAITGCVALTTVPIHAQATDGSVVGTIFDATGAGVSRADIELESLATGAKYTTKTDETGFYRFPNVPVGAYNLTAAAAGFGTSRQRITIELNKISTSNITLQVGTVASTIEIIEAPPTIDTTTAQVQSTFTTKAIADLPTTALLLGPLNVSLYSAGVASSGGTGLGEGPSVGGMRPRNNSFNIEGIDNNRKDVTGSNIRVPNEATSEVTILQNQYSAEFGHAGGGIFNTLVKSGTKDFHGTLYHYLQNRKFNAIDETNARQDVRDNPRYDDNRIGGNLSGPILKDKMWFFGTYEYNPIGFAGTPAAAKLAPTAEGFRLLEGLQGLSRTNLDIFKQYVSPAPSATTQLR